MDRILVPRKDATVYIRSVKQYIIIVSNRVLYTRYSFFGTAILSTLASSGSCRSKESAQGSPERPESAGCSPHRWPTVAQDDVAECATVSYLSFDVISHLETPLRYLFVVFVVKRRFRRRNGEFLVFPNYERMESRGG